MRLKAINCKNMGAILVHQQKPEDAPTDLVAEVHSGFEDAKHIAECVNAANDKREAWPEDVADGLDPTAIQGGIVGKPVDAEGRIPELMKERLKHFMIMSTHHRDCRLSALEKLAQVEAERNELLAALEYCRSVFDKYISLHLDKSPPDYDKAAGNEKHRAVCDAAIASAKGGAE